MIAGASRRQHVWTIRASPDIVWRTLMITRLRQTSHLACLLATLAASVLAPAPAAGESGYRLWLRYTAVDAPELRDAYRRQLSDVLVDMTSATGTIVREELRRGLHGLLAADVPSASAVAPGTLLVGSLATSPRILTLGWTELIQAQGPEGYLIRTHHVEGGSATVIAASTDVGALYGTFHLLRLLQTRTPLDDLQLAERPQIERRLLNHWDNLDGSVERGYAGSSLWRWKELPGRVSLRLVDYARANASIGINGVTLNNVNAKAESLTTSYIEKAAALANLFRPYGIRVYLSANFAAPRALGDLPTADPREQAVADWWRTRVSEIYRHIPDFGGLVVKANSEGQPGPQDYQRTHADGANMLADALAPHGGVVMWRAFVYDDSVDADRIKRAYLEFVPLDGQFRPNVLVQVKNGPLDFQPREPFHPLFGAMPKTPVMPELQITQEYLGQATHLVYLAPMWREFLDADTYATGPGSTVARVADGSLHGYARTAVAGVANTGRKVNWTGHHFAQANWFAFGRLAWDPAATSEAIADDWIRMTWTTAPEVVRTIAGLMMGSRETYVRYTMPLGLHHLIGGDHYAPMPDNADPRRADWSAIYYHRADPAGIGVERGPAGTNAVAQYRSPLREQWSDPATTPLPLLLWFHRLPWDYRLPSGQTLWTAIIEAYTRGAREATGMLTTWTTLEGDVDRERYQAVREALQTQADDAARWRDLSLAYFQRVNHRPLEER